MLGGGGITISLQKINVAIDWHDGFQVAVNVELNEVWSKCEVWQEHLLSSRPMCVDLLIKKDREIQAVKREGGIYDLTGDPFPCNWLLPMNLQKRKIIVLQSLAAQIYLGIKDLAVCSDAVRYKNINKSQPVRKLEKQKRRLQRSISRSYEKNKKGKNYCKTHNIVKKNFY